jgi:hypothetical protein
MSHSHHTRQDEYQNEACCGHSKSTPEVTTGRAARGRNDLHLPDASADSAARTRNCPICGMALEPDVPTEQENDGEIRRVRNRFWIALALAAPVVAIAMLGYLFDIASSAVEAGILYPISGWLLNPLIAALAMSLSSVSVISNALRLRAPRISREG